MSSYSSLQQPLPWSLKIGTLDDFLFVMPGSDFDAQLEESLPAERSLEDLSLNHLEATSFDMDVNFDVEVRIELFSSICCDGWT